MLKDGGIGVFCVRIVEVVFLFVDRFKEICFWDDVYLLSVWIDCLKMWWKFGLLFIGDVVYVMLLIGGVGVNFVI